ncbi:PREDICTED: uncharacterized protein LOC109591606 isoform X2 [Amphimedon queenslandica]|uniref:Uncharacterized protein n=1 Tax=Amphimedon queenslandica TaxID=400682 RepID=A0A1X7ST75_AMPQE|nr:PREDICTED: uncharacterized protein LOC109591606 isoform X2 [Amphimedon queenslandica]|eukprot:XP_019862870.1 PREDICTED: uncharacterized protein LOC109591606 isoform X2 [Amphimedon queenslandica]
MTAVDEGDDGGQQETSACQGDDQLRETENCDGQVIPTVNVLPEPVQPNVGVRESKYEALTSEKFETKVEQNEKPKFSVKELYKNFEIQENESFLKPTSTSPDNVNISPRHEPNKSPSKPPQLPSKPRHLRPLQNEVERRPRSAAFSMRDKDELHCKLSEQFCQKNHSSLPSQESTSHHEESTKENIAHEDSPEKYDVAVTTQADEITVCEVTPEDDEGDCIQMCEAPNENTPCEDTPDEDPKENDANETVGSFNGLQNQPIQITDKYAAEASINAVEKKFGHLIAEAFRIALKYIKKPGQWFVKVIKKKNHKSTKSN